MKCIIKHNSDTNVTIIGDFDAATLADIKKTALNRLNTQSLKIDGFRAGKAPLSVVEKHVPQQSLQQEFIDLAINHCFMSAIRQDKLRTIGQPDVSIKKFVPFTTFEVSITSDVLGKVTLPDYKKHSVTVAKTTVVEQDVKEVIDRLRQQLGEHKEVSRPAKEQDMATIDFAGTDDNGKPVAGAEGKGYPLTLGSNSFIPGFESNVVGMKPGETKKFDVVFPKDYNVKALQNKNITFSVTLNKLESVTPAKADDAMAAKAGPFKTLKDLKADIKKQLTAERQQAAKSRAEQDLILGLAQKTKVAIAESLVEQQIDSMEAEEKRNVVYRGQTWQQHLESEGVSQEEHRQRQRPGAIEQIKVGVMLGAIAEAENITVTPEEVAIRIKLLKGQYPDPKMQAELDKPEAERDIASRIQTEKTIDLLMSYANNSKGKQPKKV